MWLFTLVHTLFSLSYNLILYYNAACCHRRGSVHRLSDSSVGWSVCYDRGTQLGTRNRVLGGRPSCEWAILREKRGVHWVYRLTSTFIQAFYTGKNVACALSVGFFFYWAHRTRRSQYEARGANCLKMNALHSWICTWNCCHQKPFFSPKWRNRPIVIEPPGCARIRWGSWERSPEPIAGLNFPEVMPTPELPLKDNCKIKIKCNARICFDDINTCIIALHNNLYLYVTHGNIFIY